MLKVLLENISNLIAAGEVVSRPASVVKELVENSIDAGAQSVSVIVTDAGRTMIQVIDDGCGMSAGEAELCFERHATSKIATADDLENIVTFGFRGEALPSIAAVSEVTLKSRRSEDETGVKVTMAASRLEGTEPVSTPKGTNLEIRNLFYNVPARRKFLKSDAGELKQIVSEFLRVAVARADVALRLVSNGRDLYNLRKAPNHKQRIKDIFGGEVAGTLSEIKAETSVVNVRGYIGTPEQARKTSGLQYFFINGRFFKSPYLHKAVCNPYSKLIPEGYVPTYFIFLETGPDKVDVNIHPAKTEVKFEDESMIFEIISAAVREGLGRNSLIPMIDFDVKGAPEIPTMQSTLSDAARYAAPPKIDFNPLFDPFKDENGNLSRENYHYSDSGIVAVPVHEPAYGNIFGDSGDAADEDLFVLRGKYIVTATESGLTVVNITRARERIFYERYMERLVEEQPLTQQTLFPTELKLTVEDVLTLREESSAVAMMGFDLGFLGDDTVSVNGLPEGFGADADCARKAVEELLASLREECVTDDFREVAAARMARSAASSGKEALSRNAARNLLELLYCCRCPQTTSDGRKIITTITIDELEKRI